MKWKFKKKSKPLHSSLMKNYIITIVITTLLFIISLACIIGALVEIVINNKQDIPKTTAKSIVRSDYKNIDISDLKAVNGWVEILYDYKVIHVIGDKKDNINKYSMEDILDKISGYESFNSMVSSSIKYTATAFTGIDDKKYICLVKTPPGSSSFKFGVNDDLKGSPIESKFNALAQTIFLGLIFVIILYIIVFSRITAKKITTPLSKLTVGIVQMSSGYLSTRIDLNGSKEFEEIKDAFNNMAKRLEESEKNRKKLEESKNQMFADISHDLKTPITSIQGYSKALKDDVVEDYEKQKKYLDYIYRKSVRLANLIEDLFMFTKLDCLSYKLNKEENDFAEFLREVINMHYMDIESKGFELNVDIPEHEIIYNFDKTQMYRAISNIIINALKYNPEGTTLEISFVENTENLELKIKDNGVGISKDMQKKIFNEFVRGDSSRKSDGGSGLGLSITKKIINLHSGDIYLKSDINVGSEFVIRL